MTRTEFIETVADFYDLRDFCNDNGIEYCQYIMDQDELNEYLDEYVRNNVLDDGWERIRDFLSDIPTGYDFYDTEYEIGSLNDDFEEWKEEVLNIADRDELWDEEPEEEEDFYEEVDSAYDDEEPELVSKNELMLLLGGQTA